MPHAHHGWYGCSGQTFRQRCQILCYLLSGSMFRFLFWSGVRSPPKQGWFHGRRWLVWLFPLTYPSYRVLLMSRESAKCSFLKQIFFYNNSPIYSNNLIASKKLVTWHPLGRHIPIPYSSWTETYQKNHLSKNTTIFWLIYRGNV